MVMLMKTITVAMDPPVALQHHRERGERVSPLCFLLHGPPEWREVLPLVLGLHGDDGPSVFLLHGLW